MPKYALQSRWYWESGLQFKVINKRLFYAACYGNAEAELVAKDFFHMYLMGGEL